jgi:hypothetical protein
MDTSRFFAMKAFAALAAVILAGVFIEREYFAIRANSGPHAWYVVYSVRSVPPGRAGNVHQFDSIEGGPFPTESRCKSELETQDPLGTGPTYCRELLTADAKAIEDASKRAVYETLKSQSL